MASTARIDELKKKFDENPRRYFAPLANEFRKAGDVEQAIMICEEFLPQQPGHMSGHIVYGQALFDLSRLDEARTVFETALSLDPENLIALRHLGDIARAHGDLGSARSWYQRVLEADPRNEEVQQVIASLVDSPAAATALPAPASASDPAPAAPINLAVTEQPGLPPLPAEAPVPADESFIELDMVEEQVFAAPGSPRMEAPPPDVPFDEISLEGVRGLEDGFESGEFSAPSASIAPIAGLEETAVGSFEKRENSEPSPRPFPALEPAPEFNTDSPVELPPEVIAAEADLLDERGESESATAADAVTETAVDWNELTADEPRRKPTPAQPFVTETMAELYLKQGFREQALGVYNLLLAANPENERLRERVADLQPQLLVDSGPNVREFFARMAARRPGEQRAAGIPPSDDDFAAFETVPVSEATTVDAYEAAAAPAQEPSPSPAAAAAPRQSEGSIDALFDHRPVGGSENSAASALAQAFGGSSEPPPIGGRPARAASSELSLDSVFRDGGARPPRGSPSFSFDQFFSESAASERASESAPTETPAQGMGAQPEPAEHSADDIEQFNSWLQGLKQR